jgi:hypothetical protein
MDETSQSISYLLKQDPWVIAGLLLIGLASILFMHIQLKLLKAGYKSFNLFKSPTVTNWNMPGEYLKVRGKYGWSAWPVYLLWPSLFGGVLVFVVGLLKL